MITSAFSNINNFCSVLILQRSYVCLYNIYRVFANLYLSYYVIYSPPSRNKRLGGNDYPLFLGAFMTDS